MQNTITIAPALPEIDTTEWERELNTLGDEILLGSARTTKVATVKAGQARQESRAWSFGGNVD